MCFQIIQDMKKIKVSPYAKNIYTKVDDDDYKRLSSLFWRMKRYVVHPMKRNGKEIIVSIHRLILGVTDKNIHVDHINGDRLDNRKCNLRLCNPKQNGWNRKKQHTIASSKYKGVTKHKGTGKWQASIRKNGQFMYLGCYEDEKEAARAYNAKAKELFGEFAHLNDI